MQARPMRRFALTEEVDFIVVGSGSAGGILAKELSSAGHSAEIVPPRAVRHLTSSAYI